MNHFRTDADLPKSERERLDGLARLMASSGGDAYARGLAGAPTRREDIAVRIAVAIMSNPHESQSIADNTAGTGLSPSEVLAKVSVGTADALLAELAK